MDAQSDEHPLAGLVTPDDLVDLVRGATRGVYGAIEGAPMPRGYHERVQSIKNMGLEAVHCPTCQWPGIVVSEGGDSLLINHHGRLFACRVTK